MAGRLTTASASRRETLQAVRERIGPDRTLGLRISADEFMEGGLTLEEMCKVVRVLASRNAGGFRQRLAFRLSRQLHRLDPDGRHGIPA